MTADGKNWLNWLDFDWGELGESDGGEEFSFSSRFGSPSTSSQAKLALSWEGKLARIFTRGVGTPFKGQASLAFTWAGSFPSITVISSPGFLIGESIQDALGISL
jgi:hypothetical protein